MNMTDDQVGKIARAIRLISHGEHEPAGLEVLAMMVARHDGPCLSDSVGSAAEAITEVADSNARIANALERIAAAMEMGK
jgi:hypothetical protein